MKGEKWLSIPVAAVLAFGISFGVTGCLVTGFDLNVSGMAGIALACAGAALAGACCFQWKYGFVPVLCTLALGLGYLWREGTALKQLLSLITHISTIYDRAYGCGVLLFPETAWNGDYPIALLGVLIALSVSRAVCRGKGTWMAGLGAVMPLALCFVVTDTVPGSGYLFPAMAGLVLLILPGSVRKQSRFQADRLTLLAALPVVLALAGLFAAIPREGFSYHPEELRGRILSWAENAAGKAQTAVGEIAGSIQNKKRETIDLQGLGRRLENTIPVMEVTAGEGGMLYLRGQDYDEYTGTGWVSSEDRRETFGPEQKDGGTVTIRTRHKHGMLYLPYYPGKEISLTAGAAENTGGLEYSFSRTALPENWREVSYDARMSCGEAWEEYTLLSDETRAGAQALLEEILPGGESCTQKADAIATHVRNCAEYDLDPSRMDAADEDFALWFLENADRGYCVHFATAATVLLRAAGVPARYVTGYAVKARAGEAVTVTGVHAHAWAEYYEPALDAWIVLEATPADFHAAVEETAEPSRQETAPSQEPDTPETTEEPVPTQTASDGEETLPPAAGTQVLPEKPEMERGWLKLLAVCLGCLLAVPALSGQRRLRRTLRRAACRRGDPNTQALARWRETEKLAKLLKEPPPAELAALAQKAKFSQHTLTAEELCAFDAYLRTAARRFGDKPWYLRLVYKYVFAVC